MWVGGVCGGEYLRVGQHAARQVAVRPVGRDADVGQDGRGDGEQQVGHGEVEQEAVGDGAHLPVPENGPRDGRVGRHGRGEDDRERGHLGGGLGRPVAEFRVEREEVPLTPAARRVVAH